MLGVTSNRELDTCHPKLQQLIREVDKRLARRHLFDFTVIQGHRGQEDQERDFAEGKSQKHWPDSKHNASPSHAVDVAPYPIDWSDRARFAVLAGYILATADDLGIEINVGALWTKFPDLPHVELTETELAK